MALLVSCALVHADPGALDTSFNAGTAAGTNCCSISGVLSIAMQPDQNVVVVGYFRTNSASANRVMRLHSDGSVDRTFDVGMGADQDVYSVTRQDDGKILLAGAFSNFNGVARPFICRLNSDGSVDRTFDPGAGPNSAVYALALQPDGKVVIAGSFTGIGSLPYHELARFNPDGSLDSTFLPGTGAGSAAVRALALQPDGKILVGGQFSNFDGKPHGGILRLNSDGTPDTAFTTNPGANGPVTVIAWVADGNIVIGGQFTRYNSSPVPYITRVTSDGSIDPRFNLATDSTSVGSIASLLLQPDGKMILAGFNGIARFYPDGGIDPSFSARPNQSGIIYAQALQPDGKLLVGGEFIALNGVSRYHVARLEGDPQLHARLSFPDLILTWPTSYVGYGLEALEAPTALTPPQLWLAVTNAPAIVGGDRRLSSL